MKKHEIEKLNHSLKKVNSYLWKCSVCEIEIVEVNDDCYVNNIVDLIDYLPSCDKVVMDKVLK